MSNAFDRRRALASFAGIGAVGLLATPAFAQSTPAATSPEATITVTATGTADAPATIAIGQIVLHPIAPMDPVDPASSSPMEGPIVVTQDDIDAMVGALTEAGVDSTNILTAVGGYFGQDTGVVVFQIEGEAIKTLGKTFNLLTDTAVAQGVAYDQPSVALLADGCDDLRAQAFESSVSEGRIDAGMLATAMGVELGALIQATKISVGFGNVYTGGLSDSCSALVNLGSALSIYLPGWNPAAPNTFTVTATVQLTFATA